MENTIYFKDISNCDKNNYPNKIYRVEHSKMLIEILDDQHIQGSAQYFSSIRSRNNFIDSIKNNILKISIDELKKIQHYWKIKTLQLQLTSYWRNGGLRDKLKVSPFFCRNSLLYFLFL